MQLHNKKILILSPNSWGDMQISKHHYSRCLAKLGNKVFFLNPPNLNSPLFKIEEVNENLFVIDYKPIFRGQNFIPRFLFNLLIKIQIKFIEHKIGNSIDIVWSFTTSIFYDLGWFSSKLKIFHPVDQLNSDDNIVANADIALTCSNYILEEIRELNCSKHLIPHGLSTDFVEYTYDEWSSKKSFQICYVGNLFIKNLDRSLIRKVVNEHEMCSFHFIGAVEPKDSNISAWVTEESLEFIDFLRKARNVKLHGKVPSNMIPSVINEMDAFLICYTQDKSNVISNSHKILEYLSTGRVVISSFVEHYENSDLIEMIKRDKKEDFISLFNSVLTNIEQYNCLENQIKRKEYAFKNSYLAHLRKIEQLIIEYG